VAVVAQKLEKLALIMAVNAVPLQCQLAELRMHH